MNRVDVTYALITNQSKSKVLMVFNIDHDRWSLPGGTVEQNEALDHALIREVKEETGLEIKLLGLVALNECKFEKLDEHIIFFTFKAEITGGQEEIIRPDEISKIAWIDISKAENFMPYYREGIRKLIDGHESTYTNQGIE